MAEYRVCRDETESHVRGFSGAKFKKFKSRPEAERWYKSNLPQRPGNQKTTTATHTAPQTSPLRVFFTSTSGTGATPAPSGPSTVPVPKPLPQSTSRTVTAPAPRPVNPPRIAAPKNTTVDIVYSDGACKGNGGRHAVAGIGVWWGHDDPRYNDPSLLTCLNKADQIRL